MKNVFIGSPVRNRAWIMERHLQSLEQQAVQKHYMYILNDSEDQTEHILDCHQIPYLTHNLGEHMVIYVDNIPITTWRC